MRYALKWLLCGPLAGIEVATRILCLGQLDRIVFASLWLILPTAEYNRQAEAFFSHEWKGSAKCSSRLLFEMEMAAEEALQAKKNREAELWEKKDMEGGPDSNSLSAWLRSARLSPKRPESGRLDLGPEKHVGTWTEACWLRSELGYHVRSPAVSSQLY
jgi:hypothetical protein